MAPPFCATSPVRACHHEAGLGCCSRCGRAPGSSPGRRAAAPGGLQREPRVSVRPSFPDRPAFALGGQYPSRLAPGSPEPCLQGIRVGTHGVRILDAPTPRACLTNRPALDSAGAALSSRRAVALVDVGQRGRTADAMLETRGGPGRRRQHLEARHLKLVSRIWCGRAFRWRTSPAWPPPPPGALMVAAWGGVAWRAPLPPRGYRHYVTLSDAPLRAADAGRGAARAPHFS